MHDILEEIYRELEYLDFLEGQIRRDREQFPFESQHLCRRSSRGRAYWYVWDHRKDGTVRWRSLGPDRDGTIGNCVQRHRDFVALSRRISENRQALRKCAEKYREICGMEEWKRHARELMGGGTEEAKKTHSSNAIL